MNHINRIDKPIYRYLLVSALILSMLLPSAVTAADEVNIEIIDGYEATAADNSSYSVEVTYEESYVGDEVGIEAEIKVESFPSASDNNPEGNINNRLGRVEISLSEGMQLVQSQDINNNDTTIQYSIFDKDNNLSQKSWIVQYTLPLNPGEETLIKAQAASDNDRLSLYERIIFFFNAIISDGENQMTFKAEREPDKNPNNPTGHQFSIESSLVKVIKEEPEQEDPEGEDPEIEEPEVPVDEEPESPVGEPEIILTALLPVLPEFPEIPEGEEAEAQLVPSVEQETEIEVEPEEPAAQPEQEFAAAAIAQNARLPWLLLLLIPGLLWLLLARMVLVRVPDGKGNYKTVARKIARYQEKRWFVEIDKELEKYLAKHGELIVDFRGGLIKKAKKAIYRGKNILSVGEVRFALVNRQQVTTWLETLQKQSSKVA